MKKNNERKWRNSNNMSKIMCEIIMKVIMKYEEIMKIMSKIWKKKKWKKIVMK